MTDEPQSPAGSELAAGGDDGAPMDASPGPEPDAGADEGANTDPNRSPELLATLATAALTLQRPEEALAHARRAAELRPDWPEPIRLESMAEAALGQPDQAVAAARRAVSLGAGDWRCHCQLAAALEGAMLAGKVGMDPRTAFGQAREAAEAARELAPDRVEPLAQLARIETMDRHRQRAQELIDEALALDPDNQVALSAQARLEEDEAGSPNPALRLRAIRRIAARVFADPNDVVAAVRLRLLAMQPVVVGVTFAWPAALIAGASWWAKALPRSAARDVGWLAVVFAIVGLGLALGWLAALGPAIRRHIGIAPLAIYGLWWLCPFVISVGVVTVAGPGAPGANLMATAGLLALTMVGLGYVLAALQRVRGARAR